MKFQSRMKGKVHWRPNAVVDAVIIRVNRQSLTVVLLEDIYQSAYHKGDIVNIALWQFKP